MSTNPLDVRTHLAQQQAPEPLLQLIDHLCQAALAIAHEIQQGPLAASAGSASTENVQGETQKKLDIVANDIMIEAGRLSGVVAAMASEEEETICLVEGAEQAPYLLVFDPLDGSSNIDVNVSVGSIFSILPANPGQRPCSDDLLQAGERQLAAGYVIYGPSVQLVLSVGQGTHMYVLEPAKRRFVLCQADVRVPEKTAEFAINASNQRHWFAAVSQYVDECLAGREGVREQDFNMRWIASMVADVHRILCRGGVFLYPGDKRLHAAGKAGKLRLLYEANPMAMLIEQAGGLAIVGEQSIQSVQPKELHQRVPVILGSAQEVQRLHSYHEQNPVPKRS